MNFNHLISGFDTIECAYYLTRRFDCTLNYEALAVEKDILSRSKMRGSQAITLGNEEFLLASHGTASGYPFLIENAAFVIQFGEFNNPNFFVKFRSIALWHHGAQALHQRFLAWAASLGMEPFKPEHLSRVDFAFDYYLPEIDFDEDSFISQASKDNQHRKNGKIQTLKFGTDQVVLRVYNKCDEINDAMQKPQVFEAIIIHSLSRFFRDGIQFGVYERKLIKNKVKVVSITQPTSDDAGGEMMRRIINMFDEHQSKENSKHTSRARSDSNARPLGS